MFEKAELEICELDLADIIATSGQGIALDDEEVVEDIFVRRK